MNLLTVLVLIFLIFISFTIILPFLIFPNQLFKTRIQRTGKLRRIAGKLKGKNKEETLKKVYSYVLKNYTRERYNLVFLLSHHFYFDVEKILKRRMFLPCHAQNLVLITLLVNAEFSEKDIERKQEITKFLTIHQYVLVLTGGKRFKVDPFFKIMREMKLKD